MSQDPQAPFHMKCGNQFSSGRWPQLRSQNRNCFQRPQRYTISGFEGQGQSKNCSKRIHCTNHKEFVHVACTRILQQFLANSVEITQSNVQIVKLSFSMAKPPWTNPTTPQHGKTQKWTKRLHYKEWKSIRSSLRRRLTIHWTRWHHEWIVHSNTKAVDAQTNRWAINGTNNLFLGKRHHRITSKGDHYEINLNKDYTTTMLEEAGMTTCKPTSTPGPATNKTSSDDNDNIPVRKEEHSLYKRTVGKLQWMTYTRPDLCFARTNSLQQPIYLHLKGTYKVQKTTNSTYIQQQCWATKTFQHWMAASMPKGQDAGQQESQQQARSSGFLVQQFTSD